MKFSICADIMYRGMEFKDKLIKIKECGFETVEFWNWSNKDIASIKDIIKCNNMSVSCFCIDSRQGEIMTEIGEFVLNCGKKEELLKVADESISIAKELGAKALITTVGDSIEDIPYEKQIENVIKSLNYVKNIFEENEITLLVEPINLQERKNYLTPNVKTVIEIIKEVNSPCVKVLYDVYHQAMEKDFSVSEMMEALPYIGHIHIADVPGRNEPGTGIIDYKSIFKALEENNYTGYIGAEFRAKADERTAFEAMLNI